MSSLVRSVTPMWKALSEIDINRIRDEAAHTPRLAIVGSGEKSGALQGLLQHGPRSEDHIVTAIPSFRLPLSRADVAALADYDLRIVLLDRVAQVQEPDVRGLLAQPAPALLVLDGMDAEAGALTAAANSLPAGRVHSVVCPLASAEDVQKTLFPAIVKQLPDQETALGRAYPGLRPAAADHLIQETSSVNARYAAGTGLAEMVPGIGIPFAMADMFILTKNQAIMAYKLGLMMGEDGTARESLGKVLGVVGAGFVWRQIARELLGFLPLGVVLKTGVAYAGSYTTGQAVYRYFTTGEKLRGKELRALFDEALTNGREAVEQIVERTLHREDGATPRRLRLPAARSLPHVKLPRLRRRKTV